jgi:hypothetical protein
VPCRLPHRIHRLHHHLGLLNRDLMTGPGREEAWGGRFGERSHLFLKGIPAAHIFGV